MGRLASLKDIRIWSLLSRGTATWRAVLAENKPKKEVILKTLWRSQTQECEFNVNGHIKSHFPGVAELRRKTHACVTAGILRSLILDDNAGVPYDATLHRLVLQTAESPLWDADTTKDFILVSRCTQRFGIRHQRLVEQGILHRDLSPGNIFVGGGPDCAEGWEGFVADLDLASVAQPDTETVVSSHPLSPAAGQLNTRSVFLEETVPGAEITGIALMAEEFLSTMFLPDEENIRPAQIKREVHHDLE
ncbi:uncharacterized protein EDB93DRAFT_1109321 [Suillus bovinus]|uniref:uncharacterized protein n=1 Tax=Suillus bovinus TaxID=48563 RepID=UPI001B876CD8|nr:uncharacterized protein EDB93DRAFT_1109321 [Suillus bovinus]KAG2127311.1 hypothetical protein EDB93DRAFT_1109321 [Suillus bovinus]